MAVERRRKDDGCHGCSGRGAQSGPCERSCPGHFLRTFVCAVVGERCGARRAVVHAADSEGNVYSRAVWRERPADASRRERHRARICRRKLDVCVYAPVVLDADAKGVFRARRQIFDHECCCLPERRCALGIGSDSCEAVGRCLKPDSSAFSASAEIGCSRPCGKRSEATLQEQRCARRRAGGECRDSDHR